MMNVASIKAKIKRIDYRHYITLLITLVFALLGAFVYSRSYIRFSETVIDFVQAIIIYFKYIIGEEFSPNVSLLNQSSIIYPLQASSSEFGSFFVRFADAFVELNNFKDYCKLVFKISFYLSSLGGIFVLTIYLLARLFGNLFFSEKNKDKFQASKPLVIALLLGKKIYTPVKQWFFSYVEFLKYYNLYLKIWLLIWFFNLNISSIVFAFLAYFFYFSVTYNVSSLFFQFYKLVLDLSLMFSGLPILVWLVIAFIIYALWALRVGRLRLQRIESSCEKFVKSLKSVVVFFVGTMGKGKTKLMTDVALTQRNIFRDKAFEILRNKDLLFPNFPWVRVENLILSSMRRGRCSKLTDVNDLIKQQWKRLEEDNYLLNCRYIDRHNRRHNDNVSYVSAMPFGYDYINECIDVSNGLYYESIFHVVRDYAQAFFIYASDNLNVSNYSIRFDDELKTLGNFPLWDYDFTNKNADTFLNLSRYSFVLDFDMMRLTRKLKNKMERGLLSTGVITITEIGKERGNQLELQGIKKEDKNANQKNDGFNKFIKFCRHLSTVSFFPFIKVLVDDQRPESWGADGKDLTQIIRVGDEEETRSALPFFSLFDFVCNKILEKYTSVYYKYRFYREDRTLLIHVYKTFASTVYKYWSRAHNRFDYTPIKLYLCDGNQEGESTEATYYLAFHKIYSNRYSTDCYSEIFQSVKSIGLLDLPEYSDIHMSTSEFEYQNSYLYQDLDGISKGAKDGK